MVKPEIKKRRTISGISFLFFSAVFLFNAVPDIFLSSNINDSTSQLEIQNNFWKNLNKDDAMNAGANRYESDWSGPKYFTLDLNELYEVSYSDDSFYSGESAFSISIIPKINDRSIIDFDANKNNLEIINNTTMSSLNEERSSMNKQQQEELEKLAIQKFKEFQKEYFKVAKSNENLKF